MVTTRKILQPNQDGNLEIKGEAIIGRIAPPTGPHLDLDQGHVRDLNRIVVILKIQGTVIQVGPIAAHLGAIAGADLGIDTIEGDPPPVEDTEVTATVVDQVLVDPAVALIVGRVHTLVPDQGLVHGELNQEVFLVVQ